LALRQRLGRSLRVSMSVIGFVNTRSADDSTYLTAAFHRGLAGSGYVEGQNLTVEYR
jgi:putative tryptophan/tyrosine transport system substrate-binding protein